MSVEFDPQFFKEILNSEGVAGLCEESAGAVLREAQASAPVDTGEYRDGLKVVRNRTATRVTAIVVGEDWKTLLVESQTGNLGRAVRKVTKR